MNYITLSSCPMEEECAQMGADFYLQDSTAELTAYVAQLKRQFPQAQDQGVSFVVKNFVHDFGTYTEVVAEFDETDEVAVNCAYGIENSMPANWDVDALSEIARSLAPMIASESERAIGQRHAWMNTPVVEAQQGRELLRLIRKARRGDVVTPDEVLCHLTAGETV